MNNVKINPYSYQCLGLNTKLTMINQNMLEHDHKKIMLCTSLFNFVYALQNAIKMSADNAGNIYTLPMANTVVSLFSIVLLCITAAQGRKRLHLNNERLTSYPVINDIDGICKTMVETQGYTCEEHQVHILLSCYNHQPLIMKAF